MGLLDPKLDKPRTFELLRKRGAVTATLAFEGGHDEGDVQSITLTKADGSTEDLDAWYCGGYTMSPSGPFEYTPLTTPANEDEELSDLLQGPINQTFGSWGGWPSTCGTLTWIVADELCQLEYESDEPVGHESFF